MAFKYTSLGTGKALQDVARSSLEAVYGPSGTDTSRKRKAKGGVRHGTPKGKPVNTSAARRQRAAEVKAKVDAKQGVADAAGRGRGGRPPGRPPGRPGGGRP